jgi:hypothetical protein
MVGDQLVYGCCAHSRNRLDFSMAKKTLNARFTVLGFSTKLFFIKACYCIK